MIDEILRVQRELQTGKLARRGVRAAVPRGEAICGEAFAVLPNQLNKRLIVARGRAARN
jgi:hypothetical protein